MSLLSAEHVPAYQEQFRFRQMDENPPQMSGDPSQMSAYINESFQLRRSRQRRQKMMKMWGSIFCILVLFLVLMIICPLFTSNKVRTRKYYF